MPGFADPYLNKHGLFPAFITKHPPDNLQGIVIIPCYNEPDVILTLESLRACNKKKHHIEVIIIINASEKAPTSALEQNLTTFSEIQQYAASANNQNLSFYPILVHQLPEKKAGAGLARKIGMDEAVRRFNLINNKNAILFSMDADTLVERNYFASNFNLYEKCKNTNATTVYFEHRPQPGATAKEVAAIEQYEIYLRYFTETLRLTGFPYALHTIGSCFTIKANTYCKQGGMNQKQGAEDFYFLQKIFPLGHVYEVNDTTVFPSSRISNRNPFGTGPTLQKLAEQYGELKVYNPASFLDLKQFFAQIPVLFQSDEKIQCVPASVMEFYTKEKLVATLKEIKQNSTNLTSFTTRFYRNFNNFFVVKYLNFSSRSTYEDIPVYGAAKWLLHELKQPVQGNDFLSKLREIQKTSHYSFIPPR